MNEGHVTHMSESCHTCGWGLSHIRMSHVTHERVVPHMWMRHCTCLNEACHTYEYVMSHIRMRHVTHINESCRSYEYVMPHIWIRLITHTNEACHTHEWVISVKSISHATHMGWLRLVGSLKSYVSFAEYHLFYRALLQKRPTILRSPLVEATHMNKARHIYMKKNRSLFCKNYQSLLQKSHTYGVATISSLLKIIGLFCRI